MQDIDSRPVANLCLVPRTQRFSEAGRLGMGNSTGWLQGTRREGSHDRGLVEVRSTNRRPETIASVDDRGSEASHRRAAVLCTFFPVDSSRLPRKHLALIAAARYEPIKGLLTRYPEGRRLAPEMPLIRGAPHVFGWSALLHSANPSASRLGRSPMVLRRQWEMDAPCTSHRQPLCQPNRREVE